MSRAFPKSLVWIGIVIVVPSLMLAARLVWEQTVWTWHSGPQMVGFSLMHGGLGILLLLALWGGILWIAAVAIFAVLSRSLGGRYVMSLVVAYGVAWMLVSIPYGFWQRQFVERLAQSPRAAEFVVYAAAKGDLKTVRAFLSQGISPDIAMENDGGTALHAAALKGHIDVIEYLLSRGANINALNKYGDTPAGRAVIGKQDAAVRFLIARGGKDIRGTEERRNWVIDESIRRQSERLGHRR